MHGQTTSRILISGVFLLSLMIGAGATAQVVTHPASSIPQQPQARAGQNHVATEHSPACQRIINECENLGFIQGQWKKDNGLWRDCFDPVVKGGGHATRDGRPINVPVSASDVQACRASESHRKQGK